MHRRPPPSSAPRRLALALLLGLLCSGGLAACKEESAAESGGRGLVLLPDDSPLAPGVETRDPRPNFHDFGRVPDGDTVAHVFRLRNEDPRDVSVTAVDPGCGCTVAALRAVRADGTIERGAPIRSKNEKLLTVAPGELVEIEVRVATRDLQTKNDHKLITIRVQTDSPNGHYFSLEVHVIAEQPFAVVPEKLALGDVPESGGGEGKVEIVGAGHFAHRLKELLPPPEGLHAVLSSEVRSGIAVWVLSAGLSPPLKRGPYSATLRVATEVSEGVPGREVEVPVTAVVVADLATQPERLVFAVERAAGGRTSSELHSRLAGHRLRVTGVEVPEAHRAYLAASFEPLEPDDGGQSLRWRVTLETRAPLPAEPMLAGKLRLLLDDPSYPSHEVEYVVHLR